MINTQQLIVMMPLFEINLPANAQAFFNQIFKIASFDIIEVEPYVNAMLDLNSTEPLTRQFDKLGFQSMFLLNNLGPLGIAFLVYAFLIIVLLVIDPFVGFSPKLGRFSNYLFDSLFYNSITSIMMESYALMATCVMINLNYIRWNSWGEIVQNSICFFSLGMLILFPIICVIYSRHSWEQNQGSRRQRIQPFFDELSIKKGPIVLLHPLYFLIRRFIMATMVVFLREYLFAQILIKALSIIFACYLISYVEAFALPERRRFEYFNEVVIMFVLYNMICFSNFVPDVEARYTIGFFCIFIVSLHLGINLFLIVYHNFKKLKFDINIWLTKRRLRIQRDSFKVKLANAAIKKKFSRREKTVYLKQWEESEEKREFELITAPSKPIAFTKKVTALHELDDLVNERGYSASFDAGNDAG